jgi:Ca2+-binding EF-hand superfamily protein
MFNVFDPDRSGDISKQEFILNVQGMNINLTLEEILELFNFIDEKDANRITITQFKDSMSYLMAKMGGQNLLESSQCAKNILAPRKKVQNT